MYDKNAFALTRKDFLRGTLVGAVSLALGSRVALAAEPVKVGFIVPDYEEMRWKAADQRFFEEEAKKLNLDIVVQSSNNSESQQANQVENMLTLGVQVLVLTPVNANAAAALVVKAKRAGVPVIDYNFLIPKSDVAVFIGRDAVEIGESIGSAALKARPKGNYILCFGDQGMSVAVDTAKGNLNALQPAIDAGDITVISQQYNKAWSTNSARAQVENALTQANNDVAAVVCSNDGMAYGAIQALQAQGLAGKVFVTGVDCEPHAQELIREGLLSVSNFSEFDGMGRQAAQSALALATGKEVDAAGTIDNGSGKPVPWIKVPNVNVTKDNIDEMTSDHAWWFAKA
ncbi:substrate-binding domain-containing protein [Rhodobium gokarnense]|uniref:D-xylose transport system substrate-binding protein n=1 Tax=Rhodobium gokarnense TaxID=364296 RepID=A0ABT3HDP1_9HYPH|nr:substrate-binding domain-containing protein [Rhodobium gokarnense]MCW2308495.1 D-xylose transport system substrate-binding protein [Rhodobium gokarnense]